ncbi:MAG: type II toxin-antitoxin system death-on-curing family toxin [Brevundimonas sp.]|uniref:type II toxin-antitoxin system death-on-curing family toxin n=1 Tax=Brevundimonas sp. TaxID=1871086 RepID=UPI002568F83A|nr:type II toxin-antitoxin system death-on-curing family toxin [Brevundimonas sp.]MDK2746999.1 type II toxin-antitoxin system death-on-curing family toxin [Brevundimonas sp.]
MAVALFAVTLLSEMMFDSSVLCDDIRGEYDRWMLSAGDDIYASSTTLGIHDVLRAHFLVANYFYLEGEGLGGVGPMSLDMLHSTLYRQHVAVGSTRKWTDRFDICATLVYGIVKNHVFQDANKRTAFLTALLYLKKFSRTPDVTHKEFEDFFVDIADDKLGKYDRYKHLVRKKDSDPEVRMISYYLKSKTRDVDKKHYSITYRELKRILRKFDCDIDNPHGNLIDVYKDFKVQRIFRSPKVERRRVAQIGFPSWGKQVGLGAISTVRSACGLTADNGIDSQVFYNGVDDLESLIAFYEEPLRSLAYR